MFIEFNLETLQEWNKLSFEEKEKAILNDEVQVAVDICIEIGNHNKIFERHEYFQVFDNYKLINDISILKITDREIDFSIKSNGDSKNLITMKPNAIKTFETGTKPYSSIYQIKVSNVKYGKIVEL